MWLCCSKILLAKAGGGLHLAYRALLANPCLCFHTRSLTFVRFGSFAHRTLPPLFIILICPLFTSPEALVRVLLCDFQTDLCLSYTETLKMFRVFKKCLSMLMLTRFATFLLASGYDVLISVILIFELRFYKASWYLRLTLRCY